MYFDVNKPILVCVKQVQSISSYLLTQSQRVINIFVFIFISHLSLFDTDGLMKLT